MPETFKHLTIFILNMIISIVYQRKLGIICYNYTDEKEYTENDTVNCSKANTTNNRNYTSKDTGYDT